MNDPRFLTSAAELLQGLEMGGVGVWRWPAGTQALGWSPHLEQVHGLKPGSYDGTLASFQNDVHPDDASALWHAIQSALDGAPYQAVYRTRPHNGEEPRWIETRGGLADGEGDVVILTGVCLDVTERVRNEQELQRRLDQQTAIKQFGSFAYRQSDLPPVVDRAVAVAAEVLDVPLTKILKFEGTADNLLLVAGIGWQPGLCGSARVGIDAESQAGYTLTCGAPVVVADLLTEARFSGPPLLHAHGVRSGMSVVIPGSGERPFGVFGVHDTKLRAFDPADVDFLLSLANIVATTARHVEAEEQRTLLLREMAHRAGNLLQVVNSIANQTFGASDDIPRARSAFSQRLEAMARANHLIARGGWSRTRLVEVVRETLLPFGSKVHTEGRDLLLAPELCFDLGLILHELATNSAKYGSLGRDDGQVDVTWRLLAQKDDRVLEVIWQDPLPSTPSASAGTGFGSRLLRSLVERKWAGTMTDDQQSGYTMTITLKVPRETS
jgi:PAS domain S-box-containing protein